MTKPTFFETGPEKVVPVRKVYDGEQVSYPEGDDGFRTPKKTQNNVLGRIRPNDAIRNVQVDQSGQVTVNKLNALLQIRSALKDQGNPIDKLTPGQQHDTLENMGAIEPVPGNRVLNTAKNLERASRRTVNKITGSIDMENTRRLIRSGDINSVNGVVGIVNELANGNVLRVNDFTSRMSVIQGVLGDLQRFGILDSIDYVLRSMSDVRSRKRMLTKLVPMFFISGDIDNLNTAIDSLGAGRVMAIYPQGIAAFCSGFRFHWRTKPNEYYRYRNRIIQLFNRLDNRWNVVQRNGVWINNYEALTYMSDNFYRLFYHFDSASLNEDLFVSSGQSRAEQTVRLNTMVLTARNFPSIDIQRFMAQQYPKASFTFRRA